MLELFLGRQQLGAVTVCSCHHSEVARFLPYNEGWDDANCPDHIIGTHLPSTSAIREVKSLRRAQRILKRQ